MPVELPPRFETRAAQTCVRITVDDVRQPEIGARLPPLLPELFGWLAARGIAPCGPPFFRYVSMGHGDGMTVDVGVPVATKVDGDARVAPDLLPAGRYAVLTHIGDFANVHSANIALHDWLNEQRIAAAPIDGRSSDGAHLEFYISDPSVEPDPTNWITEVAIRLQA